MAYADGFLIPVPTKNLADYKKLSMKAGKVWIDHGALDYKECAGDDLFIKGMTTSFPDTLKVKKGETVVFSWILYRNKAHRNAVNKKVMADPRLATMITGENSPFDHKRMLYGGFETIVDLSPSKRAPAKKAARRKARA